MLELEGLDDLGRSAAGELRTEFAGALVRVADGLWERDGGATFAVDYYASALVFDPEHARALERSRLSRGEMLALVEKAERGGFSRAELVTGESLAILAEEDPVKQAARVEALVGGEDGPGVSTIARLEGLLEPAARMALRKPRRKRRGRAGAPGDAGGRGSGDGGVGGDGPGNGDGDGDSVGGDGGVDDAGVDGVGGEAGVDGDGAGGNAGAGAGGDLDGSPGDGRDTGKVGRGAGKAEVKELVGRGNALRRQQKYGEARQRFNQALRINRRHAGALAGLARLEFDLGNYDAALRDADKAVRAAPGNASYRLLYGDTLRKVRRFEDARRQFEKARALGAKGAARRLEELQRTLGE